MSKTILTTRAADGIGPEIARQADTVAIAQAGM